MTEGPFYFVVGPCWSCKRLTSFDPQRVPSMPLNAHGEPARSHQEAVRKEPLCPDCVRIANERRKLLGLELWPDDPSIWEPVEGMPD